MSSLLPAHTHTEESALSATTQLLESYAKGLSDINEIFTVREDLSQNGSELGFFIRLSLSPTGSLMQRSLHDTLRKRGRASLQIEASANHVILADCI